MTAVMAGAGTDGWQMLAVMTCCGVLTDGRDPDLWRDADGDGDDNVALAGNGGKKTMLSGRSWRSGAAGDCQQNFCHHSPL